MPFFDDELLLDALEDLVGVLLRGGADVRDGRVVHELALSSARVVVRMSQEHIVAVPLEEHTPEIIELGPTRFRLVSGEDSVVPWTAPSVDLLWSCHRSATTKSTTPAAGACRHRTV